MFFLKKKQKERDAVFAELKTDLHSHLVPGIDDGSPDLDTSIELITALAGLGYTSIITTPHVMVDLYPNSRERITEGAVAVQHALLERGIDIRFRAAAEYMLDAGFDRLLTTGEPLLTITDNIVLVECSFVSPPLDLKEKLFDLQIRGYRPLLAHPERYAYFHGSGMYDELKYAGCLFQVNLLSLTGHYGKAVATAAQQLLRKNLVDFLGTDLHHSRHLQALTDSSQQGRFRQVLSNYQFANATID